MILIAIFLKANASCHVLCYGWKAFIIKLSNRGIALSKPRGIIRKHSKYKLKYHLWSRWLCHVKSKNECVISTIYYYTYDTYFQPIIKMANDYFKLIW